MHTHQSYGEDTLLPNDPGVLPFDEFEFINDEEDQPSLFNSYGLFSGNPNDSTFCDPKALLGDPPQTQQPVFPNLVAGVPPPSHRGSSSSSSHETTDSSSSNNANDTAGDVMILDHQTIGLDLAPANAGAMLNHDMSGANEDLHEMFDFDSASRSPSPPQFANVSVTTSPKPKKKRSKGQSKARFNPNYPIAQPTNGLENNPPRELTPGSEMSYSQSGSPSGQFHTPPPERQPFVFGSLNGLPAGAQVPLHQMPNRTSPAQLTSRQKGASQKNGSSRHHPKTSANSLPKITIHHTQAKSRVETQINIMILINHLPPSIKNLHLPPHTISKSKLLAKLPGFVPTPDTYEMTTMLVSSSAMTDPDLQERAFRIAAAAKYDKNGININDRGVNGETEEEKSPQRGDGIMICQGCMQREKKRSNRKKQKKAEEEQLWERYEAARVVVFNTAEVKEWQPVTPMMADPTGAGLLDSVPEGTYHIEAPMRITCYCRHHNEKMGFQVIFTLKDWQGTLISQAMSSSIMITDDHKTHPNPVGTNPATAPGLPAKRKTTPTTEKPPDLAPNGRKVPTAAEPNYFPQTGVPPAVAPAPKSSNSTPQMSRQPSPSMAPNVAPGASSKRRKMSSNKVPSGLTMTRMDNQQSPGASSGVQSEAQTPIVPTPTATSPFSPGLGNFSMNVDGMFSPAASGQQPARDQFWNIPPGAFGNPGVAANNGGTAPEQRFPFTHQFQNNIPQPLAAEASDVVNRSRNASPNRLQSPQTGLLTPTAAPIAAATPDPPMIYKIIPGEGPKSGGVEVTILGRGFTNGGMEVKFGDNRAPSVAYWSEASVVCMLPPSQAGGVVPVSIRLINAPPQNGFGNQQNPLFRYIDDDENRLLRTAMAVLGGKLGGKITDVGDIARNIIYGMPTGGGGGRSGNGQYNGSSGGQSGGQPGNNFGLQDSDVDIETSLLRVLELIDFDDSPTKANLNLRRTSGHTMLHYACSLGLTRFVAALLSRGANVAIADKGGYTPLHMAAMNDHPEIVRRLIVKGADPSMRSLSGQTPADVAQSREVITILRRIGTHARSRSGGSLHSRANSAGSLRSLWDPPDASAARRQEFLDDEESNESEDTDPYEVINSDDETPVRILKEKDPAADVAKSIAAAMAAYPGQVTAQVHEFLQNLQLQMPQNVQAILQDAQAYKPSMPSPQVMQRISSFVPNIRSPRPGGRGSPSPERSSESRVQWPSLFGGKEAPKEQPPAYDEIYPREDLDTKHAGLTEAAAEAAADEKCAATFDLACEEETAEVEASQATVLHVGRKKAITREQQETLQRAHAASLKTGSSDKMLWFFWIPLLICAVLLSISPIAVTQMICATFNSAVHAFNTAKHHGYPVLGEIRALPGRLNLGLT